MSSRVALSLYAMTANFTRLTPSVIPYFMYMRLKFAFTVRYAMPNSLAMSLSSAPVSNKSTICRSLGVKFTPQGQSVRIVLVDRARFELASVAGETATASTVFP